MAEAISVAPVDATATLEALFGPLKCDGLMGYDFADVSWLWQAEPLAPEKIWHQRFIGADLAALQLQLAQNLFRDNAAQRILCNIGHAKLDVGLTRYNQVLATVAAHFNVPVLGTIWRWPGEGYVIDVLVSALA